MYYNPNLCFSVFRYFPFKKFNAMDHGLLLQIEPVSKLPEISANVICSYMGSRSIWIHKHRLQAKPQQRNPFLNYRKTLTCSLFRNGLLGCRFFSSLGRWSFRQAILLLTSHRSRILTTIHSNLCYPLTARTWNSGIGRSVPFKTPPGRVFLSFFGECICCNTCLV